MMERRGFLGALAASLTVKSGGRDEWIVVADNKTNANRRQYSSELIARMADTAKGRLVMKDASGPVENGDLANAIGACVESRIAGGQLLCRFRWFEGRVPLGMRVTPQGIGTVHRTPFGFDSVGRDYRLTSFALNAESAFEAATKI